MSLDFQNVPVRWFQNLVCYNLTISLIKPRYSKTIICFWFKSLELVIRASNLEAYRTKRICPVKNDNMLCGEVLE